MTEKWFWKAVQTQGIETLTIDVGSGAVCCTPQDLVSVENGSVCVVKGSARVVFISVASVSKISANYKDSASAKKAGETK